MKYFFLINFVLAPKNKAAKAIQEYIKQFDRTLIETDNIDVLLQSFVQSIEEIQIPFKSDLISAYFHCGDDNGDWYPGGDIWEKVIRFSLLKIKEQGCRVCGDKRDGFLTRWDDEGTLHIITTLKVKEP